jgi:hypothetical protein
LRTLASTPDGEYALPSSFSFSSSSGFTFSDVVVFGSGFSFGEAFAESFRGIDALVIASCQIRERGGPGDYHAVMRFGWMVDWPAVEHVALVAQILGTAGTLVYVYFTFQIMKWAVGQGKKSIELAEWHIEEAKNRRAAFESRVHAFVVERYFYVLQLLRQYRTAKLLENAYEDDGVMKEVSRGWDEISEVEMPLATREAVEAANDALKGLALLVVSRRVEDALDEELLRAGIISQLYKAGSSLLKAMKPGVANAIDDLLPLMAGPLPPDSLLVMRHPVPESDSAAGSVSAPAGLGTPRQ